MDRLIHTRILAPQIILRSLFFFLLPSAAFAASQLNTILQNVIRVFNMVIGILFVIATIVFLWGIILYIASPGDEKKKQSARQFITWGIIGLAAMASAWGIANMLMEYLGIPHSTIRLGY